MKALNALSTYQAGYYHRVNRDTEAGAIATYSTKAPNAVNLEVGAKTYLDAAAFVSKWRGGRSEFASPAASCWRLWRIVSGSVRADVR